MTSTSRRSSRLGVSLCLAALAGLLGVSLYWDTAQAQEKGKKKGPAAKAEAKKAARPVAEPKSAPVSVAKGTKLGPTELAKTIDGIVDAQLKAEGLPVAPRTTDTEFLRRVHLDLVGVVPTPERVKAFVEDKNPNKREALVDELLKNPRFGTYHAEQWAGLMVPRESNNRLLNSQPLQKWLAEAFNANKPLNKTVYDLVTATGSLDENGAVVYFVGNPTVDKITDNVTRMFLGVQLQCAQCHNHPFVDWKQNEYWAMAAFFMKVRLNVTPQQAAKKGVTPSITETAVAAKGKKGLPESAKIVPAKFLQGESPKLDAKDPYRPILAGWMTSRDNPFFARAMVNRWWQTLFGRGIVNPVDDMHEENAPSHPAALDLLTEQFKLHDFDLHFLVKSICLTEAYQRSSRPDDKNKDDVANLSHRRVRVLTPEQLYDSLTEVLGAPGVGKKAGAKAILPKKGPVGPREQFLAFFRIDEGADPLEYQVGIPQALRLMNSNITNNLNSAIAKASKDGKEPARVIENLFLATYSRMPTRDESERLISYVNRQSNPQIAYGDILWALVNSSEFALNH